MMWEVVIKEPGDMPAMTFEVDLPDDTDLVKVPMSVLLKAQAQEWKRWNTPIGYPDA